MIKLKLSLEYHCYPLWIYSEYDELIDNNFPVELTTNMIIDELLDEIQKEFDNLFIDNEIEFTYAGFKDDLKKREFYKKISNAEKMIIETLGNKGVFINQTSVETQS